MEGLRRDIAEAESRMSVTFGIRSAIRNLPQSLEEGELVQVMVACFYSGGDGLMALTDRRVIAVRDDFSKFRLQAVPLRDVRALDYAPAVHDGLAVLTAAGRVAVRKMNRQDSDAFAAAVVAAVPGIIVGASRPNQSFRPEASEAHAGAPGAQQDGVAGEVNGAGADAHSVGAQSVGAQGAGGDAAPAPAGTSVSAAATGQAAAATAVVDAAAPAPAAPATTDADKDVMLGVLADLHAKGLLTSDELAAKIAQVTSAP